MRIGIDFDNTIAGYDGLFARLAVQTGILSVAPCGKRAVRDAVRALPGGEIAWRRLQALAYGAYMGDAVLITGVAEFLTACRRIGLTVAIVSHKTRHAAEDPERVNLHAAARQWLKAKGFFDPAGFGLDPEQVYFETSRADKILRITQLGCSHFIDDLEEVFAEPAFPAATQAILFDAAGTASEPDRRVTTCRDWTQIHRTVFSALAQSVPQMAAAGA